MDAVPMPMADLKPRQVVFDPGVTCVGNNGTGSTQLRTVQLLILRGGEVGMSWARSVVLVLVLGLGACRGEPVVVDADADNDGFDSDVDCDDADATVFPGAEIGNNCFILEDNTIQPFTRIGNDVMMWSGNHIGHHGEIKDHVLFTSHVVLSGHCIVEPYCFFGVNATVREFARLGQGSFIATGACEPGATEPWGLNKAIPAADGTVLRTEVGI